MTATGITDIVESISYTTEVSPYQLITTLNKWFAAVGIDKVLPTQMGYTYVSKGMVDKIKGTHKVAPEAATAWAKKYVTKNFS